MHEVNQIKHMIYLKWLHLFYKLNLMYIILVRSNKMQQYAGIYLLQNHSSLHVSGVHRTHHQEYIKL